MVSHPHTDEARTTVRILYLEAGCAGRRVLILCLMNTRDEELYEAAQRFCTVVEEVCRKHSNEHFRNGHAGGDEGEEDHDLAVGMDCGKQNYLGCFFFNFFGMNKDLVVDSLERMF